jgi:putative pyruvate formate lyase activating enzyme
MKVASIGPHYGEEPPISGTHGSGTVFFSGCNLRCVYCQNFQISWEGIGDERSEVGIAEEMLKLQERGCHNINLVSPTHVANQVRKVLVLAKEKGLKVPVVYNTNGTDAVSVLRSFEGLVDIYLPDIKYSDDEMAFKYSGVKNYVEKNREAIKEMFRQAGNLVVDENGIAKRGLIVRHLVLPNNIAGSRESLAFLASLSKDIWLSVMAQYHPCYKAKEYPELDRRINSAEYCQVLDWVEELEFTNVQAQELESAEVYLPDFKAQRPFKEQAAI